MESRQSQAFLQCRTTTTDRHPVVDKTILNQTSRRVVMIRRRMSPTTSSKPRDLDHHQRLRSDLPNPASVSNWWMTFGDCTNDLQDTLHRLLPTGRRGGSEFGDGSPSMRQMSATKGAVDYRSTLSSGPTTMSTIPHQQSPSSMLHMLQKKVLQLFETALLSPYANQQ